MIRKEVLMEGIFRFSILGFLGFGFLLSTPLQAQTRKNRVVIEDPTLPEIAFPQAIITGLNNLGKDGRSALAYVLSSQNILTALKYKFEGDQKFYLIEYFDILSSHQDPKLPQKLFRLFIEKSGWLQREKFLSEEEFQAMDFAGFQDLSANGASIVRALMDVPSAANILKMRIEAATRIKSITLSQKENGAFEYRIVAPEIGGDDFPTGGLKEVVLTKTVRDIIPNTEKPHTYEYKVETQITVAGSWGYSDWKSPIGVVPEF